MPKKCNVFLFFFVFIFLIKNKQINRLNMLNMSVSKQGKKILFYFKNSYDSERERKRKKHDFDLMINKERNAY